jgi:hypothetical protein
VAVGGEDIMNYRLLAPVLSLSLGLVTLGGVAMAQTYSPTGGLITDASGSDVSSGPGSVVNGDGETIIYGDITTGPGYTVIGQPPEPVTTTTGPAPAPVDTGSAPAPVDGGTVPVESAPVPVAGDVDGDNLPDSAESQNGTNPNNPDSDGDGAADGDEINIYRTGPANPDSDGDGLTDGNELFWTHTDPLKWDTDGDGYGDGDEVNTQGTDPLAAGSFPGSGTAAGAPPAGAVPPSTYQDSAAAPVGETAIVTEPVDTVSSNVAPSSSTNAAPGDTTSYGNGYVTAAPGMVENPTVSTSAPPPVTSSTTTTPPSATTGTTPAPAATTASCADYGTWYDSQVAYENAGGTTSSLAGALDPDGNGTACESLQTY